MWLLAIWRKKNKDEKKKQRSPNPIYDSARQLTHTHTREKYTAVVPVLMYQTHALSIGLTHSQRRTWSSKGRSDQWSAFERARPTAAWCSRTSDFRRCFGITRNTTDFAKTISLTTLRKSCKMRTPRKQSSFWWVSCLVFAHSLAYSLETEREQTPFELATAAR